MERKRLSSRFLSLFTGICGIVSVLGWLGISPERIGQLYYDMLHPILPVIACVFGYLAGWFARDHATNKYEAACEAKNASLSAEVQSLREKYADERAYTASLLTSIPPEERLTRNQVAEMIENSNSYDDEADAKKLCSSANQLRAISANARQVLHRMSEDDAAAFRSYLSRCITVYVDNRSCPIWPCNSKGGIPSKFFPGLSIDMQDIDRLVSIGLIGASHRIPISGSSPLRIKIGDNSFNIVSEYMFIMKTTGEHIESAFFYPLTGVGAELAQLCDIDPDEGFAESVMEYLSSNQIRLMPLKDEGNE